MFGRFRFVVGAAAAYDLHVEYRVCHTISIFRRAAFCFRRRVLKLCVGTSVLSKSTATVATKTTKVSVLLEERPHLSPCSNSPMTRYRRRGFSRFCFQKLTVYMPSLVAFFFPGCFERCLKRSFQPIILGLCFAYGFIISVGMFRATGGECLIDVHVFGSFHVQKLRLSSYSLHFALFAQGRFVCYLQIVSQFFKIFFLVSYRFQFQNL